MIPVAEEITLPEGFDDLPLEMQKNFKVAQENLAKDSSIGAVEKTPEQIAAEKAVVEKTPEQIAAEKEKEDLSTQYNYAEDFGEGATDYKTAAQRYKDLTSQLETATKGKTDSEEKFNKQTLEMSEMRGAFKNENLYKLDQVFQKDPDKFALYSQVLLNPDSIKPIDLVKMDMVLKYPEYKDKEDAITEIINEKYGLNLSTANDDLTDTEKESIERKIRMGNTQLGMDAADIRRSLTSSLEEFKPPDRPDPEKQKQQLDGIKSQWKTIATGLADKFEGFAIKIPDKDGKLQDFVSHKVSGDKNQLIDGVVNYLTYNNKPFETESINEAVNFLQQQYLLQNFASIAQTIATHVRSLTEEEYNKRYHNPSDVDSSRDNGGGAPVAKSDRDTFLDKVKATK